ncbi:LysR family transcriptional regulator [Bacillus sp. JJ634]
MNILEKMESFIVLAECHSFTEAARRLYCSQPTISHHINKLEENFNSKLFHRSGKKVELTKQGEILLHYAREIMNLVDEASEKIKKADYYEQTFPVYVSHYIAENYFSKIMSQQQLDSTSQQYYEINSYCYADLRRSLQEKQTKFAIMPIYSEDYYISNQYDVSILFEEELLLVFPVSHRWANRKVIYTRDLHHETILLPNSDYLQQHIINQLNSREVNARYLKMSNFEIIKQAVQMGHGIAFLPYGAVREEIDQQQLISKRVLGLRFHRKNGIVFQKNIELTQTEQAFCKKVKEHFKVL